MDYGQSMDGVYISGDKQAWTSSFQKV